MCYRQALISDQAKHEMWYIHSLHNVGTHCEKITPAWPQGPTQLTFKVPMLILRNYLYIPLNDLLSRHANKTLERLHLIKCTTEINILYRLQEHFYYCILKVEVYVHILRSYLRWRYYRYLQCTVLNTRGSNTYLIRYDARGLSRLWRESKSKVK